MRTVIISGGKIADYSYIKRQIKLFGAEIIICADSGYDHAVKMGLDADIVVGDFDSTGLAACLPEKAKIVRLPAEKNLTDTEAALHEARKAGAREFLFAGVTGTRADHTLTNVFMLRSCLERGEDAEIIDEHNAVKMTDSRLEITGEEGALVSLVPLCDCFGVTTEGLKYPLLNAELRLGEGRGVSNVMTGESASAGVEKGVLLVIRARD
jgi:thiamine pyrophosphokinase